jgi:acetylglutamate kinase
MQEHNMEQLTVIKIGGNIIDDEAALANFLFSFAAVPGKKILIHGGGKLATKLAEAMHVPQQMIDGRRITDGETLKIVTMVYAGYINKTIVAQLQALNLDALGLCGADGNLVLAHKRTGAAHDYGFVGDVDNVNAALLHRLLHAGNTIVVAPITHNGEGQLLNTNADTMAQAIAQSMSSHYAVNLVYSFEKRGVLRNAADDTTVISKINPATYKQLKDEGAIFAGMIPKLDNAFTALSKGVARVIIGDAQQLSQLIDGSSGTSIVHE